MRHPLRRSGAAVLLLPPLLLALATPVAAHDEDHGGDLPATFTLFGDSPGSRFEGIDVARDRQTFYVTETTGGEIHRGRVGDPGQRALAGAGPRHRGARTVRVKVAPAPYSRDARTAYQAGWRTQQR